MTVPTGPLPPEGPQRKIFIAALHEYRNSCHPPELTPSCPFFTWTANGPACGDECADLLAEYGDTTDEEEHLDLGGGIVISRQRSPRRPRRGPSSSDKPFDARELYLNDENRAHPDRRTPALFVELVDLVCAPPASWADPHERSYDIGAASEQLTTRGFDAEAIIRYGIGPQLAINIMMHLILSIAARDDSDLAALPVGKETPDIPRLSDEWIEFFNSALKADNPDASGNLDETAYFALHGFLDRLKAWIDTAQIADIISWCPPSLNSSELKPDDDDTRQRRECALWMVDRFTSPYESDWILSSLHLEWLYLHGEVSAPCSLTAMAERRTSAQAVSRQIAHETSRTWDRTHDDRPKKILGAEDFVNVALGHLRNGKSEVAAAIFEALIYVSPRDVDAHNNYGFCMLPHNPTAALRSFTRASEFEKGGNLTTLANTVLAFHLLGKDEEALALGSSGSAANLPTIRGKHSPG